MADKRVEDTKLQDEIAFLTNLIQNHKKTQETPSSPAKPAASSVPSQQSVSATQQKPDTTKSKTELTQKKGAQVKNGNPSKPIPPKANSSKGNQTKKELLEKAESLQKLLESVRRQTTKAVVKVQKSSTSKHPVKAQQHAVKSTEKSSIKPRPKQSQSTKMSSQSLRAEIIPSKCTDQTPGLHSILKPSKSAPPFLTSKVGDPSQKKRDIKPDLRKDVETGKDSKAVLGKRKASNLLISQDTLNIEDSITRSSLHVKSKCTSLVSANVIPLKTQTMGDLEKKSSQSSTVSPAKIARQSTSSTSDKVSKSLIQVGGAKETIPSGSFSLPSAAKLAKQSTSSSHDACIKSKIQTPVNSAKKLIQASGTSILPSAEMTKQSTASAMGAETLSKSEKKSFRTSFSSFPSASPAKIAKQSTSSTAGSLRNSSKKTMMLGPSSSTLPSSAKTAKLATSLTAGSLGNSSKKTMMLSSSTSSLPSPAKIAEQSTSSTEMAETITLIKDVKQYCTSLDILAQKHKEVSVMLEHGRKKLTQSEVKLKALKTETKQEMILKTAKKMKLQSTLSEGANPQKKVCFKTRHKLVKVGSPSTNRGGGQYNSMMKIGKSKSSTVVSPTQGQSSAVRPLSPRNQILSRYKVRRYNSCPEETVKRARTLSGSKTVGSASSQHIRMQSRYKLVKKAIETVHRKGVKQRLCERMATDDVFKSQKEMCHARRRYPTPRRTKFSIVKDTSSKGKADRQASGSKYNFNKSPKVNRQRLKVDHRVGMSRSSTRIDHRKKVPAERKRQSGIIRIAGDRFAVRNQGKTLFRKSLSPKTVHLKGKFRRVPTGTALKYVLGRETVFGGSQAQARARQSLQRSLATHRQQQQQQQQQQHQQMKGTTSKAATTYCLFYNRYGKCNRGNACPYVHDPARIAICTRFLRGTCDVTSCPFSHRVSAAKLPTCRFFVRGGCNDEACPYAHVNVGRHAEPCPYFLDGLCPLGDKCKKSHNPVCREYESTGACSKGRKCRLLHEKWRLRGKNGRRENKKHEKGPAQVSTDSHSQPRSPTQSTDEITFSVSGSLPAFIALETHQQTEKNSRDDEGCIQKKIEEPRQSRQIKPRFSLTPEDT